MRKIFCNKKAIVEFPLDIWSIMVFIIALFFFFVVFRLEALSAVERQLEGARDFPVSSITLKNYLKTIVNVEGQEISIAELIRLWHFEPEKYENMLMENSQNILNLLEYEYLNPKTKNMRVKGFNIIINSGKREDNLLDHLIDLKSKSFETGHCITNGQSTCATLAEQFVPISESKSLYIVLFESEKAK